MSVTIDHVGLSVSDLAAARAFYTAALVSIPITIRPSGRHDAKRDGHEYHE